MASRKLPDDPNQTRAGYSVPHEAGSLPTTAARGATPFQGTDPTVSPSHDTPSLEIAYAHPAAGKRSTGASTLLEIWTRNRIYFVDTNLVCTDVVHRGSGVAEPDHTLRGTRLSGGQRRQGERVQIVHPFPVVGYEAVFRHGTRRPARYGLTSTVERVVLHITRIEGEAHHLQPTWNNLTDTGGGTGGR